MVRLQWDNETPTKYQQGVSHGVFYGEDGVGHAWSGLIGVTEKPQTNAPTPVYNAMGEKYDIFGNIAEKKHGLTCYTYPEEMDEYLGLEYLSVYGFTVDERPPKKFHMAYRTELGDGLYEIHILLNQVATFGETARQTMTDSPALSTITMNLEGVSDSRFKSSHIILDSRLPITKSAETLLFGGLYSEANINNFLTAEPVWETVATNYAPIIEPDYENLVWLGGSEYRPGVKNSSTWLGLNDDIIVFYDEYRGGLGLYSNTTLESLNRYSDIYWDDITPHISIPMLPVDELGGTSVYTSATVSMADPISDLISSRYATIGLGDTGPTADSPPNTRGESELYVMNPALQPPVGAKYDSIRMYHGGATDSGSITFTDILVAPDGQPNVFFDVYSTPPSRGDRYQRVSTPNGDYTIHQKLRLRSRSRVQLRDITRYDFWFDAPGLVVGEQNDIYTFNGPQATSDGIIFTIDDSIQDYSEG